MLFSLLILEIFLRLFSPVQFRVQGSKIILPANKTHIFYNTTNPKLDSVIVHRKNALGFRGENAPENWAEYLTIFTVGGSTTECFHLSDGQDWTSQLSDLLKQDLQKTWVNNAGLDGQSTFGHAILLEDHLLKLKPNLLLFYVGINDVRRDDLNSFDQSMFKQEVKWREWLEYNVKTIGFARNFWRAMRAKKRGLSHHEVDLAKLPSLIFPDSTIVRQVEEYKVKYVPAYKKRIERLIKLCRENNVEPVFATQPSLIGVGVDSLTGVNLETVATVNGENGKLSWAILQANNQALLELCAAEGVFCMDVASKMPKNSKYYYDFIHCTKEGSAQIARIMAAELIPHLVEKYPAYLSASQQLVRPVSTKSVVKPQN